jgi:hypothetical protein
VEWLKVKALSSSPITEKKKKKPQRPQIMMYLKLVEKHEKIKPQVNRRKEVIKI